MFHAIEATEGCYNSVVLLQPTSPLRNSEDIQNAYSMLGNTNAESIISVTEIENEILKSMVLNESGYLEGIRDNDFPFFPRQELPSVFKPNGAIYMSYTSVFCNSKSFLSDKTLPYLMSAKNSLDIDTLSDLSIARELIKKI